MKKEKGEIKITVKDYEYTLVSVTDRLPPHKDPCFMGYANMALHSVKKIVKRAKIEKPKISNYE